MTGYVRQDTSNNISNGSVVDADDLDLEFNAVEAAFNSSAGHNHDGTSGEGAPILVVGPTQDIITSSVQMAPKTTNTYDLGSATNKWKDLYVDGIAYVDAINLGGTAVTVTGAELNVLDGITATVSELNILDGVTATAAELNVLDGVTASTAELNILDGVTSTAAELNILDGATLTVTELNYVDGVTSSIQTQLDAKQPLDAGLTSLAGLTTVADRMIYTTASDTYAVTPITSAGRALLDDASAAAQLVTLGVTATAAELNALDGITSTVSELNILDGVTANATELNILDGATLTTTELNYVDGVTSAIQTQLNAKASLASPTFTGVPAAPTPTTGTNTTQIATTAFVQSALSGSGLGDMLKAVYDSNDDGYVNKADTWTTARTVTVGSTGKSVDGSANVSWSLAEIGVGTGVLTLATAGIATGSQTFNANQATNGTFTVTVPGTNLTATAGTTAGPTLNSSTGTGVVIPSASATASGVVTTGAQTFAGTKTFNSLATSDFSLSGTTVTATGAELNYVDGVTSSIQTQLDAKQPLDSGLTSIAALTTAADRMIYTTASDVYAVTTLTAAGRALLDDANAAAQLVTLGVTATASELNILDGATLSVTELNYVDGVTSSIQTQLDNKQPLDADLTAVANLATTGVVVRTGSGTAVTRAIAAGTGLTVTDGTGASGNPTLSADLASQVEAEAGTDNTKLMTPLRVAQAARPVLGTAVASTSGTSIDFTGIPSWAKRVTILLSEVSTSSTSPKLIQIGDSGGIESTGYVSGASSGSNAGTYDESAVGYILTYPLNSLATGGISGLITLVNISGDTWISGGTVYDSGYGIGSHFAGTKTLSGTLDRIRVTTVNGTDTFDAGLINIVWE